MSQIRSWRLLRSKIVFEHRWYKLRRDYIALPDGRTIDDYFISLRPEVVLIFPVTPENEVVMVKQYKHGPQQVLIEFPGGTFIGGKEEPKLAAARELAEETGYTSSNLEFLGTAWDDPTRQDNRQHFFLARDARKTQKQNLDEHEDIEVVLIPLPKFKRMCQNGEICVTGTLALAFRGLASL